MLKFYQEEDADPSVLSGCRVAVIGYGGLGRPMALNLRDSGVQVVIGNIVDDYRERAQREGFDAVPIDVAVGSADVIFVLIPDAVIPECFERDIAPALRPGASICFASGYVLAYDLISPPANVDVLLLGPRMPGRSVRHTYLSGTGYLSCVNVEADVSGHARDRLLALAHAGGALRRGAFELSAVQEATLDLLIEQTLGVYLGLCIQHVFRLGTARDLPPEALVIELYMSGELSRTIDEFACEGFYNSLKGHSLTALYGGFTRTEAAGNGNIEEVIGVALDDIMTGEFARRCQSEFSAGAPTVNMIRDFLSAPNPMSDAEARVRSVLSSVTGKEPSRLGELL
jgi:ketol-acid reductoisomerase